jgi:hypothetical protein
VNALVRRGKELSNLAKFAASKNSPTILSEIANAAIGKPRQPLPGSVKDAEGNNTVSNLEAKKVVNRYYVEKVRKMGAGTRRVEKRRSQSSYSFGDENKGGKLPTSSILSCSPLQKRARLRK